ncbi:MAG: NADH:ubiquinone reductase (Na(+)-transporting) subunit D [Bacteroidales bacterium]|nr:NADH:ubiquinone reductase (Na(+)-transporting) subunit D [Bacteroidales bacterium]
MSSEKEPLFSAKNLKLITAPLGSQNPITVQVLGICSALAVTAKLEPSIVSLIRNSIPSRIRIIVQLVIVAALVILVDQILKAFAYEVSQQLSVFVGLIITNCIIMGRLEAFALGNKPWPSVLDGIGNAAGYGLILVIVGFVRELFGSGTLSFPGLGTLNVVPAAFYEMGYVNNGFMILPPMALIVVGIIIWVQRSKDKSLVESN